MENVFSYFFSIGVGVSFGLSVGAIPALIVWKYLKRKGEGYDRQAKKTRS